MSEVANDNVDESDEIARWTLRGVYAAADKESKHDPMGEEGLRYLEPPSPGVYYLMVEFDMTRSMAEWIANIT
jgi:hypothetical protein